MANVGALFPYSWFFCYCYLFFFLFRTAYKLCWFPARILYSNHAPARGTIVWQSWILENTSVHANFNTRCTHRNISRDNEGPCVNSIAQGTPWIKNIGGCEVDFFFFSSSCTILDYFVPRRASQVWPFVSHGAIFPVKFWIYVFSAPLFFSFSLPFDIPQLSPTAFYFFFSSQQTPGFVVSCEPD